MCYLRDLTLGGFLILSLSAHGALFTFDSGLSNGGVIPDGSGDWTDIRDVTFPSGPGYTITDVNVAFNVSGGYNGDLYATLSYVPDTAGGSGTGFVVLLNRVGRTSDNDSGYANAGFNVTLDDSAAVDIHYYGGGSVPAGFYQPDRRYTDPEGVADENTPRGATLAQAFNTLDASGTWTLRFRDMASQDTSTLVSWSLNIEAVPEPITTALIILGGIFGCFQFVRYLRARKANVA